MSERHRKLPDTQWHIGYAKKRENNPRRDKRKCRYKIDGICKQKKSPSFELRCGSSSHCKFYNELRPEEKQKERKLKLKKVLKKNEQEFIKGLYNNDCFWIKLNGKCTREKRVCIGTTNCKWYVNRKQCIENNNI